MPVYTYTTLDDPLATFGSHPRSINATGQIVGDYNNGGNHGFLLTGGTYTTFDDPSASFGTQAFGINAAGQIVGIYVDATVTTHGFLRKADGTYTTLDDPFAANGTTQAFGINDMGWIVGTYVDASSKRLSVSS